MRLVYNGVYKNTASLCRLAGNALKIYSANPTL